MKTGFTLAEVLITLAIIGVVAAISIPGLMNNTKDQEFKVAFKKKYAELNKFSKQLAGENGGTLDGALIYTDNLGFINFKKYFSVTKDCGAGGLNIGKCWHEDNKCFNTNNVSLISSIDNS